MSQKRWRRWRWTVALIACLGAGVALAQESAARPGDVLFITGSDTSSVPEVTLDLYGLDGAGEPLSLSPASVQVSHGGQVASDVAVAGQVDAGTFTLFLIDTPSGVEAQLPAIQAALQRYATAGNMREGVDFMAVFQVGQSDVTTLLAPTEFYNAVANFLVDPLPVSSGPTALEDSLGNLLNQVDTLKPHPHLAPVIVIFSDGTDVVSSRFQPEELAALAGGKGVPLHTVWLANSDLPQAEPGQTFLRELAAASRGLSTTLDDPDGLLNLWQHIASLRSRTRLRYTIPEPRGGEIEVVVTYAGTTESGGATAQTTLTVRASAPSVTINLPPENRVLTLPDLDQPVRLRFSAAVSWLDGQPRTLTRAQLLVNGLVAGDIDVNELSSFDAAISQFAFGPNHIQIVIEDEQGMQATSPEITLTINEGKKDVPEAIKAGGGAGSVVAGILLFLFFLLLFGGLTYLVLRWRGLVSASPGQLPGLLRGLLPARRPRQRSRRSPQPPPASEPAAATPHTGEGAPAAGATAYLEVLESVTRMPRFLQLQPVESRIGRSPAQADIVFENDITVSRLHASIIFSQGEYRLYDEQSTSGTWVNDQPVPEFGAPLVDGDELRLGAVRVLFRLG